MSIQSVAGRVASAIGGAFAPPPRPQVPISVSKASFQNRDLRLKPSLQNFTGVLVVCDIPPEFQRSAVVHPSSVKIDPKKHTVTVTVDITSGPGEGDPTSRVRIRQPTKPLPDPGSEYTLIVVRKGPKGTQAPIYSGTFLNVPSRG